jgi:hypothetical protein
MSETGIINIHGRAYKTVALRVSEFRETHSIDDGWAILTEELQAGDDCVKVAARILNPDGRWVAMGLAEEKRSASQINRTSALENCETSAIGRALAAAGYGGSEYASANEVENAIQQQAAPEPPAKKATPPVPTTTSDEDEKFLRALDDMKARMVVALEIIGGFADTAAEMQLRFNRLLGSSGYEKPLEITGKPARLKFYRQLEETTEALEAQEHEVAEAGI